MLPPAQLTVKIPSSSESRFTIRRPRRDPASIPAAPSMPISSSAVNTASTRGCSMASSSSTARAMATAMPSSPPRVVPSAQTDSPSVRRSSPSRSMSLLHSGACWHTMSMWPWRITGSAAS